jgi:hypothetical protein
MLTAATRQAVAAQEPQRDYDESRARHYTLPDPLTMADGTRVTTSAMRQKKRRSEILRAFAIDVYSRSPGRAERDQVRVGFNRSKCPRRPCRTQTGDDPVPQGNGEPVDRPPGVFTKETIRAGTMFLGVNFRGNHTISGDPGIPIGTNWVYADCGVTDHRAGEAT